MPAFSVPPSVRARRALVRPAVRRTAVGLLAAATALSVASLLGAVDDARDRWGATRPVAVATRDLSPGEVLDSGAVEVRDLPEGVLSDAATADVPTGAVVREPILSGEPVAPARLAPHGLTGAAALVAEGERAVAVPVGAGGAPPLDVGDLVDVLTVVAADDGLAGDGGAPAFTLVDGASVVHVGEQAVTVAVPDDDAPRVAWAIANSAVVLALTGA